LGRLKEFVGKLSEEDAGAVPACVEEYCDKMQEYSLGSRQEVLSIAERRLSK
jgi:hypothetical protein